jgi:molybdenum cofactor biosynthesis protein B
MDSSAEHRASSPKSICCAVLTISDTRTEDTDKSGQFILDSLKSAGHEVRGYRIVKDDPDQILDFIDETANSGTIQAVLINGGTGISKRDNTFEALDSLFEKKLEGFGELFRMLSYEEIGAAAMLSRASAGTYRGMIVFSMPGSTAAVRLAMEKLILPEIGHVVRELSR